MFFDLANDDNDMDEYESLTLKDTPRYSASRSTQRRGNGKRRQTKTDKPPETFEEFYDWLLKVSSKKKLSTSVNNAGIPDERLIEILPTCVVCSSRKVDVRMIVRSCLKSHYPCTGHVCRCVEEQEEEGNSLLEEGDEQNTKCKDKEREDNPPKGENGQQQPPPKVRFHPCCSSCLAHVLWESSNEYMRNEKRYRGKCPFCKAAFCANDILIIDGVT